MHVFRFCDTCLLVWITAGDEDGLGFSWFQASTDVSGLVLRGTHRYGYVLSHVGGQRLFKDTRQRFFVLLDHYLCFFDSHSPEVRGGQTTLPSTATCVARLLACWVERLGRVACGARAASGAWQNKEQMQCCIAVCVGANRTLCVGR